MYFLLTRPASDAVRNIVPTIMFVAKTLESQIERGSSANARDAERAPFGISDFAMKYSESTMTRSAKMFPYLISPKNNKKGA